MLVTSIVLAGGRSLRLGRDKALEKIGGQRLIDRVIERLTQVGDEIIVVSSSEEQFIDVGVKHIGDSYPGRGALVGLYSGLLEAQSLHNIAVGCDMPFLNVELLRHLKSLAAGFDVVIPRFGDRVEPLHAVYSKDCIAPIEKNFGEGKFKVSALLDAVKVRYVEGEEIDRFDPEHLSFFNINYEADLVKARGILEKTAK